MEDMLPRSAIGSRVRAARESRGLTLKSLADSMGVTPSLLSQVETDKVLPSVGTLYRLAVILELSLDSVLGITRGEGAARPSAPPPAGSVQRREDSPAIEMTTGVRWERLAGGTAEGVDPLLITYAPHATSTADGSPVRAHGHEFGVLVQGELSLTLNGATHTLRPGDSVHFDTSLPHVYVNDTDEEARGVWFRLRDPGAGGHEGTAVTAPTSLADVLRALGAGF